MRFRESEVNKADNTFAPADICPRAHFFIGSVLYCKKFLQ